MRILIYQENKIGGHTDIFRQLNYNTLNDEINLYCNGIYTNAGNKVWLQGIVSELKTNDNEICFLEENWDWEYINNHFDAIVYSTANLLQRAHKNDIARRANEFKHSRLPIYCISIGAQGELSEKPKDVIKGIEKEMGFFLDSIYNSGGEFGVRGCYTKEVLDCISRDNTAKVTGCPSIFQNGRDLEIKKKSIAFDGFKAILNGNVFLKDELITDSNVFIDQDVFSYEMYDYDIYERYNDRDFIKYCVTKFGLEKTRLFIFDKVKLFMSVPEWHFYLLENDYDFSFGSRIHGNICSLLSGVPALINVIDSRTWEMADFYKIPYTYDVPHNKKELFCLYEDLDYSRFNQNYKIIYDNFNNFLLECKLINRAMNENNIFWDKKLLPRSNQLISQRKETMKKYMKNNKSKIWLWDKERTIKEILKK